MAPTKIASLGGVRVDQIPAPLAAYGGDRAPVNLIVIHDIEGSGESGIATLRNATDASVHILANPEAARFVQMVSFGDVAWTGGNSAVNARAVQIELPGKAGTPYAQNVIEYAAIFVAFASQQWGIPLNKLTIPQVHAGQAGVCGHEDIPDPYNPKVGGGKDHHTDPGNTFPWSYVITRARAMGALPAIPATDTPSGTIGSPLGGALTLIPGWAGVWELLKLLLRPIVAGIARLVE